MGNKSYEQKAARRVQRALEDETGASVSYASVLGLVRSVMQERIAEIACGVRENAAPGWRDAFEVELFEYLLKTRTGVRAQGMETKT